MVTLMIDDRSTVITPLYRDQEQSRHKDYGPTLNCECALSTHKYRSWNARSSRNWLLQNQSVRELLLPDFGTWSTESRREGTNNNRTGAINLTAITAIFVYVETAARCPRLRAVQPTLFPPTRRITLSSIRPRRFQLFSLSWSGDILHHRVVAPDVQIGCERSQDSAESLTSSGFFQFIISVGSIQFFVRFFSFRYSPSHCCQLSNACSIDDQFTVLSNQLFNKPLIAEFKIMNHT